MNNSLGHLHRLHRMKTEKENDNNKNYNSTGGQQNKIKQSKTGQNMNRTHEHLHRLLQIRTLTGILSVVGAAVTLPKPFVRQLRGDVLVGGVLVPLTLLLAAVV